MLITAACAAMFKLEGIDVGSLLSSLNCTMTDNKSRCYRVAECAADVAGLLQQQLGRWSRNSNVSAKRGLLGGNRKNATFTSKEGGFRRGVTRLEWRALG